ncbi:hypothetical protein [Spirosoma fluminis]
MSSLELLSDFVQAGRGIALIPSHFDVTQRDGVIAKPLVTSQHNAYPELNLQQVVAFLAGNTSPAVGALRQRVSSLP